MIWIGDVTGPLCFPTLSSASTPGQEERQYLQLRARVWKMMDKGIGFKALELLSGEGGSEEKEKEKARLVLPDTELGDQQDSLTSEGDCSPELLEENLV